MHGLGEVREEGLDGPGGVGDLLGEQLQPYDLAGLGGSGGGQFAGFGQITGQARVDQVRRDAAAAQEPAGGLQDTQFAAAGQVAGGRAVRFEAEQGWAPAPHGEAGLGVEKGGAGGGWALRAGEVGLEGAEAQLCAEHSVAVLVH